MKESPVCCVVERRCLAPANAMVIARVNIRTKCYACGEPVCRNCSLLRKWYRYGRQRICLNCIDDVR